MKEIEKLKNVHNIKKEILSLEFEIKGLNFAKSKFFSEFLYKMKAAPLMQRLEEKIIQFTADINTVESLIERLDKSEYRSVLREHYINGETTRTIALKYNFSESNIKKLIKKGIDEIKTTLN
jgi:DNA-directed RNA polymerase specialized sigma subunit